MTQRSVLLGFSGGIDSCASAQWLIERGYRVVALTIDTTHDTKLLAEAECKATQLGIEWISIDAYDRFRTEIIDYFIDSYRKGLTPAPCTRCNPLIKWHILLEVANRLGIDHIATGHYFNIEQHNGHYYVAKGADPVKDQSYYLWGLDSQVLSRAITPMGGAIKSEIKAKSANKSESMGICFLCGKHYVEFLHDEGVELTEGDIIDQQGNFVGKHNGIARYTIGQKRGQGIPEGMRVLDIDSEHNSLIVGPNECLYKKHLYIKDCNIVDKEELLSANDITIKIRGIGRNPEQSVKISEWEDGYRVECNDAAWAPAKGQPMVIYRGNLVIGGGIVVDFN
jgi:tRNA-specific 2-thiouridylase